MMIAVSRFGDIPRGQSGQLVVLLSAADPALLVRSGDVTCLATIPPATQAEAQFLAKADGVLAGVAVADAVFREVDPGLKVRMEVADLHIARSVL